MAKTNTAKSSKPIPKCQQLNAEYKQELFDQYIKPNLHSIYTLTQRYTDNYHDVDDNYQNCLMQLYYYVGSYDPTKKLDTWLHICVKRICFHANKQKAEEESNYTDIEMCTPNDIYQNGTSMVTHAEIGNLIDNISDEMYSVLMRIPPQQLSPFLLYAQGHKIREITEMEWQSGHLEKRSEDLVKSRIYFAKLRLKYMLRQYGIKRNFFKSGTSSRSPFAQDS